MALTTASYIIGNHLYFCPAGTTLTTGVSSKTNKPVVVTDDADYILLPCVDTADVTSNSEDKKNMCVVLGTRVVTKVHSTNYEANWKVTLKELSTELVKVIFGAATLGAGATYQPFVKPRREGWFRIKQYDDNNVLTHTHDFYGSMKVDGTVSFNNDLVTTSVMIDVYLDAAGNLVTEA